MSGTDSTRTSRGAEGWGGSAGGAGSAATARTALPSTQDLNVAATVSLAGPRQIIIDLPMTPAATATVVQSRQTIKQIIAGSETRLLVIVGPCSIHDEAAALEYAGRLSRLASELVDRLHVVMRVYFEKPRTTVGWKGLINDPYLDGSFDMVAGIRKARQILLAVNEMGLPAATEVLDPITPAYIADLIAWAAIGARTIESQTHRQMASGLSMPIGYKNGTEGNLQIAIDGMTSSQQAHSFLGIDPEGRTAIIKTRGNKWGHLILRGGNNKPNYDAGSVARAAELLAKAHLAQAIMVDCSHANASKRFQNQETVWNSVLEQRLAGNTALIGMLVESNLCEGNQPLAGDPAKLKFGVSITDPCIGWEQTEKMLRSAYERLGR